MKQQGIETLTAEYLRAYKSLKTAIIEFIVCYFRISKMCQTIVSGISNLADGQPILILPPIGWITLTFNEDYWDAKDTVDFWANHAVKLTDLRTLPSIIEARELSFG